MKKRLNIIRNSVKRFRRLPLLVALAAATTIVALAAVTVISRQNGSVKAESQSQESKPPAASSAPAANKTYVTVKVAGQNVQIDSQTGQVKPLSPEEAQKLAAGLKQEINQSSEGLVQTQHPDGSISMDLDGHFQDVAVARKNDDGTVATSCVDNARSAGAFFGIDPQLIDNKLSKDATGAQRRPITPAKNQNQ